MSKLQCNRVFFSVDVLISNDGPRAIPRPFILKVTSGVKALPLNAIVPIKSGKKCKFREFIHDSQFSTFYQFLWFSFRAILRFPIRMNALLVQSTFQKEFNSAQFFFQLQLTMLISMLLPRAPSGWLTFSSKIRCYKNSTKTHII